MAASLLLIGQFSLPKNSFSFYLCSLINAFPQKCFDVRTRSAQQGGRQETSIWSCGVIARRASIAIKESCGTGAISAGHPTKTVCDDCPPNFNRMMDHQLVVWHLRRISNRELYL